MASILIIDNHDSYTFNLAQMVGKLVGAEPEVVDVDHFDIETEGRYDAIIVSPGPGDPRSEPSFQRCLELFRRRRGPILGVCLGHQGMVIAHGGSVERVTPAHGVVDALEHSGAGLLRGLRRGTGIVRYHSLAAIDVRHPLRVTARTADGVVMAVEHTRLPHFGVQFHPESVLTDDGETMVANFLAAAKVKQVDAHPVIPAKIPRSATNPPSLLPYPRWMDPADVATHLLRGKRRCFWLDSADMREWTGRYSVLGYLTDDEVSIVVGHPDESAGGVTAVPRSEFLPMLSLLERDTCELSSSEIPALGGWVGVAGYEVQEILSPVPGGSAADGFFLKANRIVVFDHHHRTISYSAASATQRLELEVALESAERSSHSGRRFDHSQLRPRSIVPRSTYFDAFAKAQDALHAGDTYEAVLTFPLEYGCSTDPIDEYLALRERNPAPFAAFLRHDTHVILSSSPERMLAVTSDGYAESRPIKGTLPRGQDSDADWDARWQLGNIDKFRRENLMIVDLVRNDLGRVCKAGSVEVTQLMAVESYERVHQLVTAVRGILRDDVTPVDCLRAVFPAGSMTGAPKRRTMEIIRSLEWSERGAYSGALGWFNGSSAEFSVVIRTLQSDGGPYRLHVGGGIIVGSTAEAELDEALDKARSVAPEPLRHVTTQVPDPTCPDRRGTLHGHSPLFQAT